MAVKQFRSYILKNRTKVIVPHSAIRSLFEQKELGERRGNWVTALQEYELEFKQDTIIKGQGLYKFLTKNHANEDHDWENEAKFNLIDVQRFGALSPTRISARKLELQEEKGTSIEVSFSSDN